MIGLLPVQISPSVFLLGSYYFNSYLVKGARCALIEGAVSAHVPLLLEQLHYLKVPPTDVASLVVLHAHFDHIMAFPALQERFPWMQIAAFAGSREVLSNEKIVSKFRDADQYVAGRLAEVGIGHNQVYHTNATKYPMQVAFHEGDVLELGDGIDLRVLETPGHSPDGISLHLERDGVLFTSDAVGLLHPPAYVQPNHFYNLRMYEASLERIQAVGANVLCKGHQAPVIGEHAVHDHLRLAAEGVDQFKDLVLKAVHSDEEADSLSREFTDAHQRSVLAMFPRENNIMLWRVMIRRTLEYYA